MESQDNYERSYQELIKIKKSLASDSVTINFSELDTLTKEAMITAIQNVIFKRKGEIDSVRLGTWSCF